MALPLPWFTADCLAWNPRASGPIVGASIEPSSQWELPRAPSTRRGLAQGLGFTATCSEVGLSATPPSCHGFGHTGSPRA